MKSKKRKKAEKTPGESVQASRGMPNKDTIQEVVDFVSPQGVHHKIIKTTETDAYDPPLQDPEKRRKP